MKVFSDKIHNTELWLHRGQNYSNNIEDIFLKIDDQSWNGVEIDIFFSKQHNKFFITHDLPLNNSLQTLKDIFLINNKKICELVSKHSASVVLTSVSPEEIDCLKE